MKNLVILFIFLIGCTGIVQQIGTTGNEFSNYTPSIFPDRIMLSIPGNPATSRAVSWRTIYTDTISIGEIALVDPAPQLEQNQDTITGTFSAWETGSTNAMGHQVIFENLQPKTKYAYRVGNGEQWSEWFQFETSSDSVEPFSFLYFGDVQNNIKSYCSRNLRQAYSHFPNADFMLFAGDLVSRSTEEYWREFFYAGGWIFGTMPSVPVPGNHEYDKPENGPRTFSKHWNQIYTMPANCPTNELRNRCYYMDYQGVRFISVDSPAMGVNESDAKVILDWLDTTLAENPYKWSIVFTHYPIYSCSQGRNNETYRNAIKPVIEKFGVDLVLQGHDHTYCRGQNLENIGDSVKNSPMYVVSVAGPKMYGLNTSFWSDRMASNTQLYQYISVDDNYILFQAYTVAGELYDEFTITKDADGINKIMISDKVLKIAERTEIPESAKEKYTAEEIKKYHEKFN